MRSLISGSGRLPPFARHPQAPAIVSRTSGPPEPKQLGSFVTDRPLHKLAVILHADVVGSTVLVQYDETVAHQRIQDSFRPFSETIEAYGGVTHEIRGEALVAEFDRASDAVCTGIAFQADNSQVNTRLKDDVRPEVCIGISMGEVVIKALRTLPIECLGSATCGHSAPSRWHSRAIDR